MLCCECVSVAQRNRLPGYSGPRRSFDGEQYVGCGIRSQVVSDVHAFGCCKKRVNVGSHRFGAAEQCRDGRQRVFLRQLLRLRR